ncbi:uncharacterized protein LOC135401374 isoform X2 [Ornithodoros turicata]|uniref:uncharacterized protein LOC135401374 isoform X2 n=1 Tax=Ornithodoros turicata TaxID=34597 RepID=UPI00313A01CE
MSASVAILPGCQALLCFLAIILQLVSLPASYWGTFAAKYDYGSVFERGHFGLWTVCSERIPFFYEDCNSLDTYLKLTGHSSAAGIIGVVHLLCLLVFLPLAVVRVVQVMRNLEDGCIIARVMCLTKITVAAVTLTLAVVVVILSSIGTDQPGFYEVQKGWAFWVQVVVLVVDIFLVLICSLENIQHWRLQTLQEAATSSNYQDDDFSETYSNPNFDQPPYDPRQGVDGQNGSAMCPTPSPVPPSKRDPPASEHQFFHAQADSQVP